MLREGIAGERWQSSHVIMWMRGFDQGRPLAEVHRENSDELVFVKAAEMTQQGRPSLQTGCWPGEERNRHVFLPLSGHSGITMHRGRSFRFRCGRRKRDEARRHHRLLQSSTCDW